MNNEEIMGCDTLSVLVCERNIGTDANVEYTLPEYFPEIKKILHVAPTLIPPAKYASSTSAQISGTVDYRVIYVGADGGLYTAPISAEYSVNIPIDMQESVDASQGLAMMCSVCCESIGVRAMGPRRMSIRCRLKCTARVLGKIRLCESMVGDVNLMSIYKRREKCLTAEYCALSSELVETECEISPISEGMRIVDADTKVFVESAVAGQGEVNCRGEVILRVLGIDEASGDTASISKKLPFESRIALEEDIPDATVRARGLPSEVRVEVEDGRAICRIGIIIEACCLANRESEYTADAYSCENSCQNTEQMYDSAQVLLCKNANLTVSERLSSEEVGVSPDAEVITAFVSADVNGCKQENDKFIFDGIAKFSVICCENGEYSCTAINLPFRYESDAAVIGEMSSFLGTADAASVKVSNDHGTLALDSELCLGVDCLGVSRITALDEMDFGEAVDKDSNALIVCYPAPDDTLWSVAKRYKVAPSQVCGDPQNDKYVIIE